MASLKWKFEDKSLTETSDLKEYEENEKYQFILNDSVTLTNGKT